MVATCARSKSRFAGQEIDFIVDRTHPHVKGITGYSHFAGQYLAHWPHDDPTA
jgi:hypothetical protein